MLKESKNPSLLPHHFVDFVTSYKNLSSNGQIDLESAIAVHVDNIQKGVLSLSYFIDTTSPEDSARNVKTSIPYSQDVFGDDADTVKSGFRQTFQEFFIGDDEEIAYLSLDKDGLCNSCFFGHHCDKNQVRRKDNLSADNFSLECANAWHQISNILEERNAENPPLGLIRWVAVANAFKKVCERGLVELDYENDRPIALGIKRGFLLDNINRIDVYLSSPGDFLNWNNRTDNLLSQYGIRSKHIYQMLNIIEEVETYKKVLNREL